MDDRPHVQLFTDGACLGNPGPGGWAYILRHPESASEKEDAAGFAETTNNRMELTAVIRGLEALTEPSNVTLIGDSEYVLKGLTEWMDGWKKRGWRTSGKKPVANVELWQELDALTQQHNVTVEWVRGHTGHPENERCDEMASAAARQARDASIM